MDNFVYLKDFLKTCSNEIETTYIDESAKCMVKLGVGIVDEAKFKQWIEQSKKIETFTPEQIQDLAVKQLFEKQAQKIKELQEENKMLRDKIMGLNEYFN